MKLQTIVYQTNLKPNEKVLILWTKKDDFVQIEGTFQTNVSGILLDQTPLFLTKNGTITGEECFWISKKHIRKSSDILLYQRMLIPLQYEMNKITTKLNLPLIQKIPSKELDKMSEEEKKKVNRLQFFVQKYGFDPTDDTWIEEHLSKNLTEKKWFQFMRENNILTCDQKLVEQFNNAFHESLSEEEAKRLLIKKMRYVFGAFGSRSKGENNLDQWMKEAKEFEECFRKREERMNEWTKSRLGSFPLVSVLKPIKFWPGTHFFQCIEKIPHVFLSPDCEFIKPGTVLEVLAYDPEERWITLDFIPEVRKQLTGKRELDPNSNYVIAVHPNDLSSLDGIDQLDRKIEIDRTD